MKITVNGKQRNLDQKVSLQEFLEQNKINLNVVVVEHNYHILDRGKWKDIALKDGDNLEILQFVGGG